jgi:acetamidase/formamidase
MGCLAAAPADEVVLSKREGSYGGNIDCNQVTGGATVVLPVEVEGAFLYFGDCKAAMGDGEIVQPPEVGTLITASAQPRPRPNSMASPRVETPEFVMTVVSARTLDEACRAAFAELLAWIEEDYGVAREEAALLMGMVAHVGVCQISNTFATGKCSLPRAYLEGHAG